MRHLLRIVSSLACSVACGGEPTAPPAPSIAEAATAEARSAAPPTSTVTAVAPSPAPPFKSDKEVSIWIRGGTVVDGTGSAPRSADVIVDQDKIVFVGSVAPDQKAKRTIAAEGKVVAPGFIDAHAHTDPVGNADHALAQGITTIVVGQDGFSPDPKIASFLATIDRKKPRLNVATLIGHATVRADAGVGGKKKPSKRELAAMRKRVEKAMDEGAFGLSTGLEYDPASFADADELRAVTEPVGERGGIVMSHLRSEDDDKIEAAIDELLTQCEAAKAKAHVAHLKIVLGKGEARARAILGKLAAARARGLGVTADVYPYTASYTTLAILFPPFARPPNSYKKAKRDRFDDLTRHLRDRVNARNGPEATLFGPGKLAGKTLKEAAEKAGKPFEEFLADLGPGGGSAAYFVMDEEVLKVFLADPFVMFGTDGSATSSHPRGYGTFAKVFDDYVTEEGPLTLALAVRKASALAAETLGFDRRGKLEPGYFADVVVFDRASFEDQATFERPARRAKGMQSVIVGGVVAWDDGKPVKGRGGRALRRTGPEAP